MAPLSDQELLDRFRQDRDPDALGEIVRRYVGLVTTAARRQVRDPHRAADVAQAVFIVLVRKADSIRAGTVLPAWLFAVTRHAVANARRVEGRRRKHEAQQAMMTSHQFAEPADARAGVADEVRRVLDDGIARLSRVERSSVLMHFFGHKTHREVGEELGITEEAARKRTNRAIEKLREFMTAQSRGGAVASGAVIASVIGAESAAGAAIAMDVAVIESTTTVALFAVETTVPSAASAIARGVLEALRLARLKLTAVAGALVLLLLLTGTSLVALARRPATVLPARPEPVFAINLDGRTTVRILGVSTYPPDANSWFAADGRPIDLPDERLLGANAPTAVPPQFMLAMRIEGNASDLMRLGVAGSDAGANVSFRDGDALILACVFSFMDPPDRATIELGIADSAWKTIGGSDRPRETAVLDLAGFGPMRFEPLTETDDGGARLIVQHGRVRDPYQLVAIDDTGQQHVASSMNVATFPPDVTTTCTFDVSPDEVRKVVLQAKPFTRFVDARDISLRAGGLTRPTMSIRGNVPP